MKIIYSMLKITWVVSLLLFFTAQLQAKVFIVRENGKGGAYQLIQDAVMDASQGDTILIDGYSIDETIQLREGNNNLKFINIGANQSLLNFDIAVASQFQNYSFENLKFTILFGTPGVGYKPNINVKVYNSNFSIVDNRQTSQVNVFIYNSIGNFQNVNPIDIIGSELGYCTTGPIDQDSLIIVGSKISTIYFNNKIKRYTYVSNSIIGYGQSITNVGASSGSITDNEIFTKLNGNVNILNNYFYDDFFNRIIYGNLRNNNKINFYGNVFFSRNKPNLFNNNLEKNNLVFWYGATATYPNDSLNKYLSLLPPYLVPIDSNFRIVGYDSLIIDQGPPEPQYSDVDLTRNDIGVYGGAFPFSNFWGPDRGKSKVVWVDIPKRIGMPNDKILIKATGTSK